MAEVLVVNLTDSDTRYFGVELQRIGTGGKATFRLGSDELNPGTLPAPGTGFTGAVLEPGDFSALITALETLNEGRSLTISNPSGSPDKPGPRGKWPVRQSP